MKKDFCKIALLVSLCFCLPKFVTAGIEIPLSPFSGPILLSDGGEFDTDEFGDENKNEKETFKKFKKEKPKYSKMKAVVLSLLVPGAGHYYVKHEGRGQLFFGAEVAAWFGYFAFHSYGSWKEDDYKKYAIQHAGITSSGHDDEFYRNLIFYDSREDYNKTGRIINPGSPYYPGDHEYDWFWDSGESKKTYRRIRNDSEVAYREATFMIGVALANRIIAGIDAFRLAQKESNRLRDDDDSWSKHNIELDIKASPFASNPQYGFVLRHRF